MHPVFAHQGGWDEMLIVAIPLVLFALLLYLANRKAAHLDDDEDENDLRD